MAQTTNAFAALHGYQYMDLTTYRKSGAAVTTPVWLALDGDTILCDNNGGAGKGQATSAQSPCAARPKTFGGRTPRPAVDGVTHILAPGEADRARHMLDTKYGLQKRLFDLMITLRRRQPVYLEIVPRGAR